MRVIQNVERIAREILYPGQFDSYLYENLFIYLLAKKRWKHKLFYKENSYFFIKLPILLLMDYVIKLMDYDVYIIHILLMQR